VIDSGKYKGQSTPYEGCSCFHPDAQLCPSSSEKPVRVRKIRATTGFIADLEAIGFMVPSSSASKFQEYCRGYPTKPKSLEDINEYCRLHCPYFLGANTTMNLIGDVSTTPNQPAEA